MLWGGDFMNYDYWGMRFMQECKYPREYQRLYGHMLPSWMGSEIAGPMVCPMMYPEIYYKIYPYIYKVCDKMDNPCMPYLSEAQLEDMINECYDMAVREIPELEEYACMASSEKMSVEIKQNLAPRRPILRDLLAIILLGELFRRRRGYYY